MLFITDNKKAFIGPVSATAIVNTVDIADGSVTIDGQPDSPRNLTATVSISSTDVVAGLVTITGTGLSGETLTEEVPITGTLVVLAGTQPFVTVDSVVVSDLGTVTAGDTLEVGVGPLVQLTKGKSTLMSVFTDAAGVVDVYDGTDILTANQIASFIDGIDPNIYEFRCSASNGILVNNTDATLTVTYNQ